MKYWYLIAALAFVGCGLDTSPRAGSRADATAQRDAGTSADPIDWPARRRAAPFDPARSDAGGAGASPSTAGRPASRGGAGVSGSEPSRSMDADSDSAMDKAAARGSKPADASSDPGTANGAASGGSKASNAAADPAGSSDANTHGDDGAHDATDAMNAQRGEPAAGAHDNDASGPDEAGAEDSGDQGDQGDHDGNGSNRASGADDDDSANSDRNAGQDGARSDDSDSSGGRNGSRGRSGSGAHGPGQNGSGAHGSGQNGSNGGISAAGAADEIAGDTSALVRSIVDLVLAILELSFGPVRPAEIDNLVSAILVLALAPPELVADSLTAVLNALDETRICREHPERCNSLCTNLESDCSVCGRDEACIMEVEDMCHVQLPNNCL